MATFTPYDAGGYERQKRDVEYDYGNQSATNAYGRFLSQQRGERGLGDMTRTFQQGYAPYKAQYGQRGLSGGGVQSGVQQQAMQNYAGDYIRNYGYGAQDLTQQLQQYDLNQNNLDAFHQQSLGDIEAQKAQSIANDAQAIEYLRQLVGGL
jgi:hypothetical protein